MKKLTGVGRRVKRFLTGFTINTVEDFPSDPVEGMPILRGDIFYICRMLEDRLVWYPVTVTTKRGLFLQESGEKSWTFQHDMGEFIFITAYATNGKVLKIIKSSNVVDEKLNNYVVHVTFKKPSVGTLAIFSVSDGSSDIETVPVTTVAGDLNALARRAKIDIDKQAEVQRQRILTAGSGQMLEYAATTAEVKQFKKDPNPKESDYPYLMADIGILGETLADVAVSIEAVDTQWRVVGSKIKRVRREAKDKVSKAQAQGNVEEIESAKDIDWQVIFYP